MSSHLPTLAQHPQLFAHIQDNVRNRPSIVDKTFSAVTWIGLTLPGRASVDAEGIQAAQKTYGKTVFTDKEIDALVKQLGGLVSDADMGDLTGATIATDKDLGKFQELFNIK